MNHSSNVANLSDEQRRVLESVIGQPLASNQVVHWSITTSGRQPTAADRASARAGLEAIFEKVDRHLDEKGVSEAEWEAVVDEAVRSVRSQRDE
ncbi:MAG TPA: hypothetical protein VFI31_25440 [Pirellulales bacterium]|nr:hypothetical protein [Pirellulales bacterium]